jgi:GAF domain-containing protein
MYLSAGTGLLRPGALAASAPIDVLFDAPAEELARILDVGTEEVHQESGVCRFEPGGGLTLFAGRGQVVDQVVDTTQPVGNTLPLVGDSANARVYRTGRPARFDTISDTGPVSRRLMKFGTGSAVAVPIFVDDWLWGSATVLSGPSRPFPAMTESRLPDFAALASISITSALRRIEVQRLAEEDAALRRVATLVATGAELEQVWESALAELGRLTGAHRCTLIGYEDAMAVARVLAVWDSDGCPKPLPNRLALAENSVYARVARDACTARNRVSGIGLRFCASPVARWEAGRPG